MFEDYEEDLLPENSPDRCILQEKGDYCQRAGWKIQFYTNSFNDMLHSHFSQNYYFVMKL